MLTTAGFNRRMRKTACPVVWKAHGAQSPWAHPIIQKSKRYRLLVLFVSERPLDVGVLLGC